MPEVIEPGATPAVATPSTATVTNPPAAPGATPAVATPSTATVTNPPAAPGATPIHADTAAKIDKLTTERDSGSARIKELNKENLGHRLKAESLQSVADLLVSLGIEVNADAPKTLKARLESGDAAIKESGDRTKVDKAKKAAAAANINGDALIDAKGALDYEYSVTGEGEKAIGTVKFKDADGKESEKPLAEWAFAKWPNLKSALSMVPEKRTVTRIGTTPPANSGASSKNTSFEERQESRREERAKKTNPLMKR